MLKSHDQPTDVSRCAFVLPAVCGDVWFYARLITRVQAAEGGINAEFNVIRRLRVRLLLSEYAVAWRGNRVRARRLGCGILSGACPRALWVPSLPP